MIRTNKKLCLISGLLLLGFLVSCATISGQKEEASPAPTVKRVEDAIDVMTEIMNIPEESIPTALLRNAFGIAIIPRVFKAAYVLGGQHGKGILVVQTSDGEWSNPSFIAITGGSIGWQIGVQSADFILVFKSKRSVENITRGKFTLGADASVAAGPVGRGAEASTDIALKAEIYSYQRSRGLFAGISIKGASLRIDHEANAAFYENRGISPKEILSEQLLSTPPVAAKLKEVLTKYTKSSPNSSPLS